jgi:hypothetical protein
VVGVTPPMVPGCVRAISLYPEPRWPVALRNTRALHGTLTEIWGQPHRHREGIPNFSLMPWPHRDGCCGWAAQWLDDRARELPSRHHVSIFNEQRVLTLGPVIRYRMPAVQAEKDHILCIDTLTPVVIRRTGNREIGKTIYRDDPTAENIVSTLRCSRHISTATGLDYRRAEGKPLNLEILGGKTHSELVPVGGGKRWGGDGRLRGFSGRLLVRVDSRTRWLLEVAQIVGLGGRISLGFGRVLIREVML